MIQRELQKLFTKEMNRKEFLAHVGAGMLTLIGISGLLKHLVNYNTSGTPTKQVASGYGLSAYGGKKKS